MNFERLIAQLINDEGNEQFAYQDQFGYWTIGIGRCIDKRKGKGLSNQERRYLLKNDIYDWVCDLKEKLPWFDTLDDLRQEVLVNMSHQMGSDGLLEFKDTLGHIKKGEYKAAAGCMLNSLWAQQTPERAKRLAKMMETGEV